MNLFQRDYPTDKLGAFNFLGDYFPSRLLTGCSLQIDSKALFLENKTKHFFFLKKKSLSYLIEHRQVELVPNWGLCLYQLVFMVLESPLQRRKEIARTAVNPVSYNDDMPA